MEFRLTPAEMLDRIKEVVSDKTSFYPGMDDIVRQQILDYLLNNHSHIHNLSLRSAVHVAQMRLAWATELTVEELEYFYEMATCVLNASPE